ncbi:hypothetical protein K0M31_000224 [Melipona bicolor]|uniref:Uncharacterized protein n=1 Tax=Melipona bicolor TaxID=60889 RepID=A0AA40GDD8_9HYME|nr:hypothetical protein K0M31_000224 [Melipona bicolor]
MSNTSAEKDIDPLTGETRSNGEVLCLRIRRDCDYHKGTYGLSITGENEKRKRQESSQGSGSRRVLRDPQAESRSEPGEPRCQSDN